MAPRIERLSVKNLRSIGPEAVSVQFPDSGVIVLLGENNAGKSNITRALDILFGDVWPGSRHLEDHDFHGRDSDGIAIEVTANVSGLPCTYCSSGMVTHLKWSYDTQKASQDGNPVTYLFRCSECAKTWPNNILRSSLSASVLDANRRLDYQLSYTSKYTMLSKLMHRFHERLLHDPQRKQQLAQIFVGLVKEFAAVPEFARFTELLTSTAQDFGQNLPYRLDIDFSAYDPSNFFRSLRVNPSLNGEVRSFDELGTGQSQVLALAFAYAYAMAYGKSEGTVLVIDEPEANLHPLAQKWLAARLNNLVAPGLQVVVTTHSPNFVDLASPAHLVLVSKDDNGSTQIQQKSLTELTRELVEKGADPQRTTSQTIGPFYAANATAEIVEGLFARRCVLVEGSTEALALPEMMHARGLDVLKEGIAVVPVDGVGNIAKWLRLYTAFGIDCFCIFDTDSNKTGGDAANLRRAREDIGAALGMEGDPAEPAVMSGESFYVTSSYCTLGPNFEGCMQSLFGGRWVNLHEEAIAVVGMSKSLRARYAAQRIEAPLYEGKSGLLFDQLISAIKGDGAPTRYQ